MVSSWIFFIVLSITSLAGCVKINMQGTVNLGKDVVNTLKHYFEENDIYNNNRRSMTPTSEMDAAAIVNMASLCHKVTFCEKKYNKFLNDYVTSLTKTINSILDSAKANQEISSKLEEHLIKCLKEIKKLLHSVNARITNKNTVQIWTEIIKKTSAYFQKTALISVSEKFKSDDEDTKKKVTQKLIIATVVIETRFEKILCSEYDICTKSYECSKALNILLEQIEIMPEEKVRIFIKHFYKALADTKFYSHLSDVTAHEFQIILNGLAFDENTPTKNVIQTIHSSVQSRIETIDNITNNIKEWDIELLHAILSDIDYFYSKHRADPFYIFLNDFLDWNNTGSNLNGYLRKVLKDIADQISAQSDFLIIKLINEVRVFLELTVDPDK